MPTPEQLSVIARITSKVHELGYTADPQPNISVGPILSVYRLYPTGSTRVAQLEALASDFAVVLGVEDVLVKRLPGESSVAVFVPNLIRTKVEWKDVLASSAGSGTNLDMRSMAVPLVLGVNHLGVPIVDDLSRMPHLLVSGATGSGKSTMLSAIIASLMYQRTPKQVQFVLSDTKQVEFTHFIGAPHLIYDPAKSIFQTMEYMEWIIEEMESRLKRIGHAGHRNVHEANESLQNANIMFEATLGRKANTRQEPYPMIVFIIDELADLLLDRSKGEAGKSKQSLGKIAGDMLGKIVQKSRAAGVYVIASVQRPSVNIVEGSIKANFPARISFRQASPADSMTVLGTGGAEHLLMQGDCLYINPNRQGLTRLHAPYATIDDMKAAVAMATMRYEMEVGV